MAQRPLTENTTLTIDRQTDRHATGGIRTDDLSRRAANGTGYDLYWSPNIIPVNKSRKIRWVGHVARMGKTRSVYRVLVGKPERKKPLSRPGRRWEDNIKMNIQKVGRIVMDWIDMA